MRYLVFILLSALTVFGENPYDQIAKRNAFDLTEKKLSPILPPVHLVLTDVYLTGIVRKAKIYTAYIVIKGTTQNKFLGLNEGQQKDGIEVAQFVRHSEDKRWLCLGTEQIIQQAPDSEGQKTGNDEVIGKTGNKIKQYINMLLFFRYVSKYIT